jgi:hypothetical protein
MDLGEKLGDSSFVVGAGSPSAAEEGVLEGLFIVRAASLAEAAALAEGSPHVRRGGRVVIRPIEPT